MRKEKVCLGLFIVIVEKQSTNVFVFAFLSWAGTPGTEVSSHLSLKRKLKRSDIWHFAVSGSGGQDASWRRVESEQCSQPMPEKEGCVPPSLPSAWVSCRLAGSLTVPDHGMEPEHRSQFISIFLLWLLECGEETQHEIWEAKSQVCLLYMCVCGYMSMIGV